MSRPTVPVCAIHNAGMRCARNGVLITTFTNHTDAYEQWAGDLYTCPIGGEKVIIGWALQPYGSRANDDLVPLETTYQIGVKAEPIS